MASNVAQRTWHGMRLLRDTLNDIYGNWVCWSSTHISSTGSMFTGVHTNSHKFEPDTRVKVDPDGNGRQPCIMTASLSESLVENVTEFCCVTVHWRVSDPFPFTVMKGTLFAAATKWLQCTVCQSINRSIIVLCIQTIQWYLSLW